MRQITVFSKITRWPLQNCLRLAWRAEKGNRLVGGVPRVKLRFRHRGRDRLRLLRRRNGFRGFDARLEVQIFSRPLRQSSALYAGFDEIFDVRWHEMQASKVARERLLKTAAREVVVDPKAVQIKIENALFVGSARITHPDMRIEASGAFGKRFIDRLRMVGGGDRDNVGVCGPPDRTCSSSPVTSFWLIAPYEYGFCRLLVIKVEIFENDHCRRQCLGEMIDSADMLDSFDDDNGGFTGDTVDEAFDGGRFAVAGRTHGCGSRRQ